MPGADFLDALPRELDVHVATSLPKRHGTPRLLDDPRPEILVGNKEDIAVCRHALHDLHGIAARAYDVRQRLHPGRAVDVSDDVVILVRMLAQVSRQLVRRAGIAERATGIQVGYDDCFRRVDDLGGLAHEMDTAKGDDIRLGLGRAVTQTERVADMVGQFLDLRDLVVVRQNDRVALLLEAQDFVSKEHAALCPRRDPRAIKGQRCRGPRAHRPIAPGCLCGCGRPCRRASCPDRVPETYRTRVCRAGMSRNRPNGRCP